MGGAKDTWASHVSAGSEMYAWEGFNQVGITIDLYELCKHLRRAPCGGGRGRVGEPGNQRTCRVPAALLQNM